MKKPVYLLFVILLFSCNSRQNEDKEYLNDFLDKWHNAAASADFEGYFERIADDGIYIGTDPEERWTRKEFIDKYKPYFDNGKAWDFKAIERNIDFSSDGKVAWFDEKLDTWMGICRGSGVLESVEGVWKIKHYHLSVTLPNNLTKDFIELNKNSE